MTSQQIRALGPSLCRYLDEFADCFVSFDTRWRNAVFHVAMPA